MKMLVVLFILIAALIIFCGHAGLYYSWVHFFSIDGSQARKVLGIVMAILSVSFIISTVLVHWKESFLTEKLYLLSSAWLGIAWYFALATVGVWIILLIDKVLKGHFPVAGTAVVFLCIALAYSVYGLWNAQNPRIKNITVAIKDLPSSWQGVTAVQLSDIHLGPIHRYGFMDKVIKLTNKAKPDIVFITGDLFDGAGQKLNHLASPINDLQAQLGVYYITGNHETYVSLNKSLAAVRETKAKLLSDKVVDVNGMQILGVNYPQVGEKKDFATLAGLIDRTKPSIVLYHEPKVALVKLFKDAGANLMLSGHTHLGQMWPFNYITHKVYQGDDYGLHTDGNFSLYTSDGVGTWGPPMRTGNHPEIVVIKFVKK